MSFEEKCDDYVDDDDTMDDILNVIVILSC